MNSAIEALESLLTALEKAFDVIKDQQQQITLLDLRISNLEYQTKTKFYMKNGGQG
jgi:hypothetical protein